MNYRMQEDILWDINNENSIYSNDSEAGTHILNSYHLNCKRDFILNGTSWLL